MRVSTSMIFNNGTSGIQNRQSDLYKVQNQLSTGRRILTPGDDPIAASELLLVGQSKGVNTQFLDNQAAAQSQLSFLDSTLEGVNDELQRINELTVQAGNGAYGAADRKAIAAELKERMANLIGLANTRDGGGLYIFAGYKTTTPPFEEVPEVTPPVHHNLANPANLSVKYNGDSGNAILQVSLSKDIAISENGFDVFMQVRNETGNVSNRSIFDNLKNLINVLDGSTPFNAADYNEALGDVKAGIDHISTIRASVGARMNSLDGLSASAQDAGLFYDSRMSDLQDLDYAAAISKFSNYKMQLEAAQLSFKQSSQLNLFSIL